MFNFKKTQDESYKIKNIMKKRFEKYFSINPINTILMLLLIGLGFGLYSYFSNINPENDKLYFLAIIPIIGIINLIIGRWEFTILSIFIASGIASILNDFKAIYMIIPVNLALTISPMFQMIKEWDRAVILRFGKFKKIKGPGLFIIVPFADTINKIVDLRIRVTDFEAETTLTKDSVSVIVDALCFWMIWDPEKAILEVQNYTDAVVLSAQAALRDAIGKTSLTKLLEKREEVAESIRKIVDKKTSEWGITIQSIDITDIIIPKVLLDALSKKAQAEREKESRILLGEAEIEVANKLLDASKIYGRDKNSLKLRALNILLEGLKAGNSMLMVPSSIVDKENLNSLFGVQALAEINKLKKKNKKKNKEEIK